ncbi:MAG TPA: hypothetical protein VGN60_05170 [Devosia sp.]|jgi:hypothetical protein|nr:hypothetical protein [Devosia sp.]
MVYHVVGEMVGFAGKDIDLTAKKPWLYLIAEFSHGILYIGETHDRGGLLTRLGSHFGPEPESSLRRNARVIAGVGRLAPPYSIFAGKLPADEANTAFSGESKQARRLVEALAHQIVFERFLSKGPKAPNGRIWTIVSRGDRGSAPMSTVAREISYEFITEFLRRFPMMQDLSYAVPLKINILDYVAQFTD